MTRPHWPWARVAGVGVLLALAIGVAAGVWVYATAPIEALRGRFPYRPAGTTSTRVTGLGVEDLVPLDAMPEALLVGLLFTEDKRFFEHVGFDFGELAISLRQWATGERRLRGASTLTQQLARTVFLSPQRTLGRKVREALYALKLERHFTKDEILLLYLHTVDWGRGVYGIADASAHYFARAPDALRPEESALLVAILPSPNRLAAAFAQRRHGTPLRVRRVLDALARAETARSSTLDDLDDPMARLVSAVVRARERAGASRASS